MAENYVVKWNPEPFLAATKQQLATGVRNAAMYLTREVKVAVSRPGLMVSRPFGVTKAGGKEVPRGEGDITRVSRPGEPPRVRTGQLMSSINAQKLDATSWKVGSPLKKAFWLEVGTRNMAPRPFLRTTLRRAAPTMQLLMLGPVKGLKRSQVPVSSELLSEDEPRAIRTAQWKPKLYQGPAPAMGKRTLKGERAARARTGRKRRAAAKSTFLGRWSMRRRKK
jgi:hypothetical protein